MSTKIWYPSAVWYEKAVYDYSLGQEILKRVTSLGIPLQLIESHNKSRLELADPQKRFYASKKILILGVKKDLRLQNCSPSADYRLIIGTSCPGFCEYCYLADSLGERVFPRVYINLDEILQPLLTILRNNRDQKTTSEISSSGDPLATEHLTGLLSKTIEILAEEPNARLRVVTKFPWVEPLLALKHNGNTFFRFSFNSEYVINTFEHGTASLKERIDSMQKLGAANYPLGAIIAPIILYDNWQQDYYNLIKDLAKYLPQLETFELITFRFSNRAQMKIFTRFPHSKLPFPKNGIRHKAFGKYVYDEENQQKIKSFFIETLSTFFPQSHISYFV